MKGIQHALATKIGGVKVGVWALLGGGGFAAYRWYQNRKAGQGSNPAYTSPLSPPNLAYEPGGSLPVDMGGGMGSAGPDNSGLLDLLGQLIAQNNGTNGKRSGKGKTTPPPKSNAGGKTKRSDAVVAVTGAGYHSGGSSPWARKGKKPTTPADRNGWNSGKRNGRDTPKAKYTTMMKTRQRPKTPMIGDTQKTQRPVASHTKAHHETPKPAYRPSAPPKRTMRKVAAKKGRR